MEQRQAGVEHVLGTDADVLQRVVTPPVQLGVRADHALGGAGGTRCVDHDGRSAGQGHMLWQLIGAGYRGKGHEARQGGDGRAVVQRPDGFEAIDAGRIGQLGAGDVGQQPRLGQ
ncbi:hypothetical protein D3C71_1217650 [compost metagenome]